MIKVYGMNDGVWHPHMEKHFTHQALLLEVGEITPPLTVKGIIEKDFNDDVSRILVRAQVEKEDEWMKWAAEIPFVKWPSDWEVKAIPPLNGTIVRYLIQTPKCKYVSVYLDCYDRLGHYGAPYWEVHPHKGDVARCALKDVDELLKLISECEWGDLSG